MTTTTKYGEINGVPVRCAYRVQRDLGPEIVRLYVTTDGRIWIGYGDQPERLSHVANVGDRGTEGTSRDAVCQAANVW
jgi:hypothetical protein